MALCTRKGGDMLKIENSQEILPDFIWKDDFIVFLVIYCALTSRIPICNLLITEWAARMSGDRAHMNRRLHESLQRSLEWESLRFGLSSGGYVLEETSESQEKVEADKFWSPIRTQKSFAETAMSGKVSVCTKKWIAPKWGSDLEPGIKPLLN